MTTDNLSQLVGALGAWLDARPAGTTPDALDRGVRLVMNMELLGVAIDDVDAPEIAGLDASDRAVIDMARRYAITERRRREEQQRHEELEVVGFERPSAERGRPRPSTGEVVAELDWASADGSAHRDWTDEDDEADGDESGEWTDEADDAEWDESEWTDEADGAEWDESEWTDEADGAEWVESGEWTDEDDAAEWDESEWTDEDDAAEWVESGEWTDEADAAEWDESGERTDDDAASEWVDAEDWTAEAGGAPEAEAWPGPNRPVSPRDSDPWPSRVPPQPTGPVPAVASVPRPHALTPVAPAPSVAAPALSAAPTTAPQPTIPDADPPWWVRVQPYEELFWWAVAFVALVVLFVRFLV